MTDKVVSRREALRAGGAVVGAGLVAGVSKKAQAQTTNEDELGLLKGLLSAERNAIATYDAALAVLEAADNTDALFAFKGIVTAVALRFRGQHEEHAEKLVEYIESQRGTDDVGEGASLVPGNFVPNIKNVVDLATNAEKAAAVAYANVVKQFGRVNNAQLAAAIGGVETQHFVVLQLLARGFVTPPASVQGMTAEALEETAAKIVPKSFVVGVKGSESLEDDADDELPYYDVTL